MGLEAQLLAAGGSDMRLCLSGGEPADLTVRYCRRVELGTSGAMYR